jgi:hypothetical protein
MATAKCHQASWTQTALQPVRLAGQPQHGMALMEFSCPELKHAFAGSSCTQQFVVPHGNVEVSLQGYFQARSLADITNISSNHTHLTVQPRSPKDQTSLKLDTTNESGRSCILPEVEPQPNWTGMGPFSGRISSSRRSQDAYPNDSTTGETFRAEGRPKSHNRKDVGRRTNRSLFGTENDENTAPVSHAESTKGTKHVASKLQDFGSEATVGAGVFRKPGQLGIHRSASSSSISSLQTAGAHCFRQSCLHRTPSASSISDLQQQHHNTGAARQQCKHSSGLLLDEDFTSKGELDGDTTAVVDSGQKPSVEASSPFCGGGKAIVVGKSNPVLGLLEAYVRKHGFNPASHPVVDLQMVAVKGSNGAEWQVLTMVLPEP